MEDLELLVTTLMYPLLKRRDHWRELNGIRQRTRHAFELANHPLGDFREKTQDIAVLVNTELQEITGVSVQPEIVAVSRFEEWVEYAKEGSTRHSPPQMHKYFPFAVDLITQEDTPTFESYWMANPDEALVYLARNLSNDIFTLTKPFGVAFPTRLVINLPNIQQELYVDLVTKPSFDPHNISGVDAVIFNSNVEQFVRYVAAHELSHIHLFSGTEPVFYNRELEDFYLELFDKIKLLGRQLRGISREWGGPFDKQNTASVETATALIFIDVYNRLGNLSIASELSEDSFKPLPRKIRSYIMENAHLPLQHAMERTLNESSADFLARMIAQATPLHPGLDAAEDKDTVAYSLALPLISYMYERMGMQTFSVLSEHPPVNVQELRTPELYDTRVGIF